MVKGQLGQGVDVPPARLAGIAAAVNHLLGHLVGAQQGKIGDRNDARPRVAVWAGQRCRAAPGRRWRRWSPPSTRAAQRRRGLPARPQSRPAAPICLRTADVCAGSAAQSTRRSERRTGSYRPSRTGGDGHSCNVVGEVSAIAGSRVSLSLCIGKCQVYTIVGTSRGTDLSKPGGKIFRTWGAAW